MNRQNLFAPLFPVLILYMMGLTMIFDASSGEIVDLSLGKSQFAAFFRQIVWGGCSVVAALSLYHIGWKWIINRAPWLFTLVVIALILVFVPGIGICANGARRWLGIGGFYIQPSEFTKIILPAYFVYVCMHNRLVFSHLPSYLILLAKVCLPVVLIALEPNNGTAGVLIVLIGVLTVITAIPVRFWLIPLSVSLSCLLLFAANSTYVQKRISSYLNPEADIKGKGHQPYQAKIAAGSGGLFGKGPAKSMQKFSYLPEAQNDYIAAIFAEEYGFIGVCALLSLYLWLLFEILKIIQSIESPSAFCWAVSLYFLLGFQTFMNLGVVSGLLPSTGLNLPFFSQGGSSLMANAMSIGLLMKMGQQREYAR